jgi:hypothetical protein
MQICRLLSRSILESSNDVYYRHQAWVALVEVLGIPLHYDIREIPLEPDWDILAQYI